MASFLRQEEEEHHCSLSRLSVCCNYDGDEADGEPSDSDGKLVGGGENSLMEQLELSDSDKGSTGCQSLPATPPRRRRRRGGAVNSPVSGDKAYASENEAGKEKHGSDNRQRMRRRRLRPEYPPWVDSSMRRSHIDEQSGYGGGVVVVTRPIGGGRPLCMDLGEVKACQDLGFEIEPGQVSYTGSTMDTSSGGNSPISSNHRISSPGDDPKEVKARLKAWAHAVAFVSTTHHQIHHQPPNSL
ncbi:Uncharacterized protein Rs2_09175 [Raphanus sativus]|nr:Uncharacterized protein Rs2_09175 [Raphanus sativus]